MKKIINFFYFKSIGVNTSMSIDIYNLRRIRIGKNSSIDKFVTLKGGSNTNYALKIGINVIIRKNAYISANKGIVNIGNYAYIAHNCWIGGQGEINIGDNTLIGPNVVIVSSNHNISTNVFPFIEAPEIKGRVEIGNNSWIGANSTIVPNVKIGDNCIIGGGSVVTKDVPDNCFAAGNPAVIIKMIKNKKEPYKIE